MARRIEHYVDTSALIAFLDRSDSYHPQYRRLFSNPPPLATSSLVVAEGHGWFLRRYDSRRAIQFLAFVSELKALAVQPFDARQIEKARQVVQKFEDQPLTLADAHGLVLMDELGVRRCWSTDRHLGLTGVTLER